jgi:hypothetical protein
MVTVEDVRAVAGGLPRSYEVLVRGRIKFRVGQIVYLAFSRDETLMGFGFPKSEREYLVQTDPETFMLPDAANMRFHWVVARMDRLNPAEMPGFVVDAWAMCVPKFLSAPYGVAEEAPPRRGTCYGAGDRSP